MNKTQLALLLPALLVCAASCSSNRYKDPTDEETINVDWGSTDLQRFSEHMAQSLLESPQLGYIENAAKTDDMRVVAVMGGIQNETREHINTRDILEKMQARLLQSGKFRFVAADQGQAEIAKQVRFQQGSGRVDPAWAKAFGKQLGAEVVIYGSLSDITKKSGRSFETFGSKRKDVYYLFILSAVNVETGEILWSQDEEIRKSQVVGLFGSG